jgi:hypothetical protein
LKKENVPIDTTGTNTNSNSPLSTCIENQKANYFLDFLVALHLRPLYMHKIQIETVIDSQGYTLIDSKPWKGNSGRYQIESIDNRHVTYIYYKNGKVSIAIACSNNPFKIGTEEDLAVLYSFFGQIRDRLEYQISDPRGRIVQHITNWILKQCDFNKDIPITDECQVTLPDIQLSSSFGVFRLYVKNLNGSAYYRCEDSRVVNQSLAEYLNLNINPACEILNSLNKIVKMLEYKKRPG